jgi:hypothetical protein
VLDLTAALAGGGRGGGDFSKINRALKGHPHWRREGIYLFYTGQDADYPALFRRFLEGGFLLPPEGEKTALLPGELSPGEEVKLAGLFQAGPAAAV